MLLPSRRSSTMALSTMTCRETHSAKQQQQQQQQQPCRATHAAAQRDASNRDGRGAAAQHRGLPRDASGMAPRKLRAMPQRETARSTVPCSGATAHVTLLPRCVLPLLRAALRHALLGAARPRQGDGHGHGAGAVTGVVTVVVTTLVTGVVTVVVTTAGVSGMSAGCTAACVRARAAAARHGTKRGAIVLPQHARHERSSFRLAARRRRGLLRLWSRSWSRVVVTGRGHGSWSRA
jgi:hypothetical protein